MIATKRLKTGSSGLTTNPPLLTIGTPVKIFTCTKNGNNTNTITIGNRFTEFDILPVNGNYTFSLGVYNADNTTPLSPYITTGTVTVTSTGYSNLVISSKGTFSVSLTISNPTLTWNAQPGYGGFGLLNVLYFILTLSTPITAQVGGTLGVIGTSSFSSDVTMGSALTVKGASSFLGNNTISGALSVTGGTTLNGTLTGVATTLNGALTLGGTTTLQTVFTQSFGGTGQNPVTLGTIATAFSSVPPSGNYTLVVGIYNTTVSNIVSQYTFNCTITIASSTYTNLTIISKGGSANTLTVSGSSLSAQFANGAFSPYGYFITLTFDTTRETNAGKIGYQLATLGGLDIYGAGNAVNSRNIVLWDNVTVKGKINDNLTLGGGLTLSPNQKIVLPSSYTTLPTSVQHGGIVEIASWPTSIASDVNFASLSLDAGVWIVCFNVEITTSLNWLTNNYTTAIHAMPQIGVGSNYGACGTYVAASSSAMTCSFKVAGNATFYQSRSYHRAVRIA